MAGHGFRGGDRGAARRALVLAVLACVFVGSAASVSAAPLQQPLYRAYAFSVSETWQLHAAFTGGCQSGTGAATTWLPLSGVADLTATTTVPAKDMYGVSPVKTSYAQAFLTRAVNSDAKTAVTVDASLDVPDGCGAVADANPCHASAVGRFHGISTADTAGDQFAVPSPPVIGRIACIKPSMRSHLQIPSWWPAGMGVAPQLLAHWATGGLPAPMPSGLEDCAKKRFVVTVTVPPSAADDPPMHDIGGPNVQSVVSGSVTITMTRIPGKDRNLPEGQWRHVWGCAQQ